MGRIFLPKSRKNVMIIMAGEGYKNETLYELCPNLC